MSRLTPGMLTSVTDSLRSGGIENWADGARALALRYAMLIDRAESIARELDELRPDDETTLQAVRRLQAQVQAQSVTSDLGPKLLTALDRLGLTPMARTGPPKKETKPSVDTPSITPADQLAALRNRRSDRRPG